MWRIPVAPGSPAARAGLLPGDNIDALVMWDRGVIGVMNPKMDMAVFSLAPGSPSLAGADGVVGTDVVVPSGVGAGTVVEEMLVGAVGATCRFPSSRRCVRWVSTTSWF